MNARTLGCILVPDTSIYIIDFIIKRCRDKMDIHSTRAMRGANCWTEHQMLRSKVAFRIRQKHNRQGTSKPTKLNTAKLSTISHRRNGQLCSRSYTTQPRRILASQRENTRTGSTQRLGARDSYEQKKPSTPESVAKQAHKMHHCSIQRCLQTATKTHPCTEVRLVRKEGSGAAESC